MDLSTSIFQGKPETEPQLQRPLMLTQTLPTISREIRIIPDSAQETHLTSDIVKSCDAP